MKTFYFVLILTVISINITMAQEELPYRQIFEIPENYIAGTVAARMVDGLGFRYYWATEGLRREDLQFRPNDEARTSSETLDHILGLTKVMRNTVMKQPANYSAYTEPSTFEEKRKQTLENIRIASEVLKSSTSTDLEEFDIIFGPSVTFPFWNLINGPISDALWHVGQVVSFRRSSGNPFNSKVEVLAGTVNE
ncbi:MAG: hypothetical protein O2887_19075 [Bacteroidetes bacterium]|nr:hypothetical protein [Bacteroidota bacterium]MDA1122556.1 hypothetical protein [Bacteroidota bacterium]